MQGVKGHYLGGERVDQRLESHRHVAPTQPDKVEVANAATGRIRRYHAIILAPTSAGFGHTADLCDRVEISPELGRGVAVSLAGSIFLAIFSTPSARHGQGWTR